MFASRPRPMPVSLESALNQLGARTGHKPVAQVIAKAVAQADQSQKGTKKPV